MKKYLRVVMALLIVGAFLLAGCGNKETVSSDSKESSSSAASSSETKKKTDITDTEQEATVYWGTKGNFEEYTIVVDTTKQRKEIIRDLIAEIAKHANYDIEMTSVIIGNNTLSITFADSFNPSEELANKIYDSIYQTCYKGFGATSNYFDLPNGEQIKRSIND